MIRILFVLAAFLVAAMPAFAETVRTSVQDDQTAVELTVYNVNLGLVKDQRSVGLSTGEQTLRFMDVAASIIPTSVLIKSVADPESLRVLEQNYEYDLLNPQKLLDKYVGRKIKIVYKNPYTDKEEITEAEVLSTNNGVVLRVGDEITFNYQGRMVFPEVPENLIARPTLMWLLENSLRRPLQQLEVTYLTQGISWRADYVLSLSGDDTEGDLSGWVSIENRSGATYNDASLKLVAGDVSRARPEYDYADARMAKGMVAEEAFAEKAFFEYHIYTLQRKSTVKNNQTKQISLLSASEVPMNKEFVFKGQEHYYRGRYGQKAKQKVAVFIEFKNSEEDNLGMPLPKGVVRVYKRDHEGSLQFIGEDNIDHTPKDEKVRIKVGEAFDVVGERVQTDWLKIASNVYESAFEITLRNHKEEDVEVRVIEPIPGDWRMLSNSHPYKKTDFRTAEFNIAVPKDGEVKLTYRVRVKY